MPNRENIFVDFSERRRLLALEEVYRRVKGISKATFIGFFASILVSFIVAFLINIFIQTHMQMYTVGTILAIIGMGGILSQLNLNLEYGHHLVYDVPNGIKITRLKIVLFSIAMAGFLAAVFYPIANPGIIWKNPVADIFNTLIIVIAGALSPFIVKVIYDYSELEPASIDKRIKQLMVAIPLLFVITVIVIYLILIPEIEGQELFKHLVKSIAGIIGILYGLFRADTDGDWKTNSGMEITDYLIVEELRKVGKRTYFLSVLGWTGYILAAGTRSRDELLFGSELHIFPSLLVLRGVLGVFGAAAGVVFLYLFVGIIGIAVKRYAKP